MEEKKILIGENKIITREELFKNNEKFHKEQAFLSFEEKIKILIKLQKIAKSIKGDDRMIWNI
jgi:hypothetical protein